MFPFLFFDSALLMAKNATHNAPRIAPAAAASWNLYAPASLYVKSASVSNFGIDMTRGSVVSPAETEKQKQKRTQIHKTGGIS